MDINEINRRRNSAQLYFCDDEKLVEQQMNYLDRLFEYNSLPPSKQTEKQALLKKMFAHIGKDCYIETPFHANWGGQFVHFGDNVYANFNLTLVDDCAIYVGDNVLFGPNVTVCTATHPIHPELRRQQAEYNLPVKIGNNVWIGAGSTILPGVIIGDNTVIGAGSLVTKDIPSDVVAFGSPCKVSRKISERDLKYYDKVRLIDIEPKK